MSRGVSILFKEMTHTLNRSGVLMSSLRHHLRMFYQGKNHNMDFSLCGKNKTRINENGVSKLVEINSEEDKQKYFDLLFNMLLEDPNQETHIDPLVLRNLKRDFKSFEKTDLKNIMKPSKSQSEKFTLEERKRRLELTKKINEYLNNGLKGNILKDKELLEYWQLVNDKRFEKVRILNNSTKKEFNENTIQSFEMFFKIPSDNGVDLSAEESRIIIEDFYKKNFPMYEIVSTFEHNDEKVQKIYEKNGKIEIKEDGDHTHAVLSCKNKFTGKFDYTKQKYNFVKNELKSQLERLETKEDFEKWYIDKYFEFKEEAPIGFLELDNIEDKIVFLIGEETKTSFASQALRLGIIYQDTVFDFVNEHKIFNDKDIHAEKYIKMGETREEIFENKRRFSEEDKNGKNKELFTGDKLKQENAEKLEEHNKELEDTIESLEEVIKEEREEKFKNIDNELEEYKETKTNEIKQDIEKLETEKDNVSTGLKEVKKELTELDTKKEELNICKVELEKPENKLILDYSRGQNNSGELEKFKQFKEMKQDTNFEDYQEYLRVNDKDYFAETQKVYEEMKEEAKPRIDIYIQEETYKKMEEINSKYTTTNELVKGNNTTILEQRLELKKITKEKEYTIETISTNEEDLKRLRIFEKLQEIENPDNEKLVDSEVDKIIKGIKSKEQLKPIIKDFVISVAKTGEEINNNTNLIKIEQQKLREQEQNIINKELADYKELLSIRGVETTPKSIYKDYIKLVEEKEELLNKNIKLDTEKKELTIDIKEQEDINTELKSDNLLLQTEVNGTTEKVKELITENNLLKDNVIELETENNLLKSTIETLTYGFNVLKHSFYSVKSFFDNKEEELSTFDITTTVAYCNEQYDYEEDNTQKEILRKRQEREENKSSSNNTHRQ
jgi:hypothetical protein